MVIQKNKSLGYLIMSVMLMGLFFSCASYKHVAYFEDIDQLDSIRNDYRSNLSLRPNDRVGIVVSAMNSAAVLPFNLPLISYGSPVSTTVYTSPQLQAYTVDSVGCIHFPVLGMIHVEGMTKTELSNFIAQQLQQYLKDPVVTVKFLNFQVSVLGEVSQPGIYTLSKDRVTILDAIAMAGDMTVYGQRTNILLIREDTQGALSYHRIDLNKKEALLAQTYYVQQNDVIYIQPNKVRMKAAANINTSMYLSVVSTVLSFLTVLIALNN